MKYRDQQHHPIIVPAQTVCTRFAKPRIKNNANDSSRPPHPSPPLPD